MSFYKDYLYPHLVHLLGNPPPIQKIREQIIPIAFGKVLEIGTGSGANFPHYDATRVKKLYALEPNPGMIRLAKKQQQRTNLIIEFIDLPGERLPLENDSIDTVVSTFTLCTISDIAAAMKEIARVLKPEGNLIFFELGLSPDSGVQHWQKRLEPMCLWLFQGLHLTRYIPSLITKVGLKIDQMESGYLAKFPKSLSYSWWDTARKVWSAE